MSDNRNEYSFGDILKGSDRSREAAYHYIIFIGKPGEGGFIGSVLTHSNRYGNNILMENKHFKKHSKDGQNYKFAFDNTHLVKGKFIKLESWGPFDKIGELTREGKRFVHRTIKGCEPELWEDYIGRNRRTEPIHI